MKFFVSLDVGCNWGVFPQKQKFNLIYAEEMIKEAGQLGVDAVKFQYYGTDEIIEYERAHQPSKYTPGILQLIRQTELNMDDVKNLHWLCRDSGVEFMCTPFLTTKRVEELNPFVKRWKIRERDGYNEELIRACLSTHKDTLISRVQFSSDSTVEYPDTYKQIFCIPNYPATWDQVAGTLMSLDNIQMWWGWSNHVQDPAVTLLLASRALYSWHPEFYVEMHYKLRGTEPVDDAVSFQFDQVKGIVETLRAWERISPKQETRFEFV